MKKITSVVLATVLSITLGSSAFAGGLTNGDIEKLLSGKTAIGKHLKKGFTMKDYYAIDGKFISVRSNGKKLHGKWWMSKKRDAVCVRFKNHKPEKKFCRGIMSDGNGGYNKTKKDGTAHINYNKIVDGNKT
jgi:hypothetical protein